ncbi:MATE family efflux transporter [Photobacterium atrarenae]|uniref:MATE family efflux transporter n=1 Tax=Photobacterium atrarenae TaxID=865757 RepID=A0ABY5GMV5_9GAMM|nr:MATE family efflux transporter [Photobacterium atrarenae]UTV30653.1 MATE family efflux transporter [Photobacterium atrarenae]
MNNSSQTVRRTFWRYTIPSVAAMLVNGLYQVVDGIFVGHYVGADGLAGINMAWPIIGILIGLGLLVGLGAGSLISIYRGEGNPQKARDTLSTGLGLIVLLGGLMMALIAAFGPAMMLAQGATGAALILGTDYIDIFVWGAVFTLAGSALPMLVRNDDSPHLSTGIMCLGAGLNILLDYLLIGVMDRGLEGAAIATVLSQSVVCFIALSYFFSSCSGLQLTWRRLIFRSALALKAIGLGASTLFMYAYFSFVVALHNRLFMEYGTATHVGAFAIIGYLMTIYYLLAEGIAGGMQPPISYYFGARQVAPLKATLMLAIKVTLLSGLGFVAAFNLFPETLLGLFIQNNPALMATAAYGMKLHLFALYLDGLIALATIYFLAVNQGGKALAISVGNMLIQLPFLYLLPQWYGIDGIWLSIPLSNIVLFAVVAPLVWLDIRQRQQQPHPATSY